MRQPRESHLLLYYGVCVMKTARKRLWSCLMLRHNLNAVGIKPLSRRKCASVWPEYGYSRSTTYIHNHTQTKYIHLEVFPLWPSFRMSLGFGQVIHFNCVSRRQTYITWIKPSTSRKKHIINLAPCISFFTLPTVILQKIAATIPCNLLLCWITVHLFRFIFLPE